MGKDKIIKKPEERGVDPAWLMTKTLGISLAEAHARLAAEADERRQAIKANPATPVEQTTTE